jgi:AraC-like DNA-binding protein
MHCIIIVLEGQKIVHLKDKNIIFAKGEICFLTQNNYFMSERIANDEGYSSLIIYFDDSFIFDLLDKYKIKNTSITEKNIIKINGIQDSFLQDNISLFRQYIERNLDTRLLKLKVEELLLHALRLNKNAFSDFLYSITSTSPDRNRFILEANIDLLQNIDDMCHLTRLSQNQLRRYIKKHYNLTPKVWIDTQRLEKATLLLKNTNQSITDISLDCGYSTVSWFISQFKKHYKMTPKEFRYKI